MRDALSFNMIPIVQDNFEGIDLNSGLMNQITSISSSNGYYGYQPPLVLPVDQKQTIYETVAPTIDNNNVNSNNFNSTDMDIQFNCYSDTQDYCADQMEAEAVRNGAIYRFGGKKRQWDADFPVENSGKKRRQNCDEPVVPFLSTVPEQHSPSPPPPPPQTTQKTLYLRTPTHNIPDLPRCIMGHYI